MPSPFQTEMRDRDCRFARKLGRIVLQNVLLRSTSLDEVFLEMTHLVIGLESDHESHKSLLRLMKAAEYARVQLDRGSIGKDRTAPVVSLARHRVRNIRTADSVNALRARRDSCKCVASCIRVRRLCYDGRSRMSYAYASNTIDSVTRVRM